MSKGRVFLSLIIAVLSTYCGVNAFSQNLAGGNPEGSYEGKAIERGPVEKAKKTKKAKKAKKAEKAEKALKKEEGAPAAAAPSNEPYRPGGRPD